MFTELEAINARPKPFEFYTANELWTDEYTSQQMLEFHLNDEVDLSSRNTEFINRSVDWIVNQFGVGEGTKIADFGCGPGLYTTRLAGWNADVTGIDFSVRSLQYAEKTAKEKGLDVRYIHQNYLELETKNKFDLILLIMCDYCALSPKQRKKLLKMFNELLYPGGSVLLDVHSLEAFNQREEKAIYEANLLDGFWSAKPYYGFLNTFVYRKEKIVLDKYTLYEEGRTRTIYNWLQYFSQESLLKELNASGFEVQGTYANVAGALFGPNTNEFAVVARKR